MIHARKAHHLKKMEVTSCFLLQVQSLLCLGSQSSAVCVCITGMKRRADTFTHWEQQHEILRMMEKVGGNSLNCLNCRNGNVFDIPIETCIVTCFRHITMHSWDASHNETGHRAGPACGWKEVGEVSTNLLSLRWLAFFSYSFSLSLFHI